MGLAPIQRQVGPSDTAPLPMASADAFGAAIGRGIEGIGESLDRFDRINRQVEANEQNAEIGQRLGAYQDSLRQAQQDARANAAAGAVGYAEQMAQWRTENSAHLLDGITDHRVRQLAEAHLAAINGDADVSDHGFVIGKRAEKTASDNDAAFDTTYGTIRNAGSIDAALAASARELPAADARIGAMQGVADDWKEQQRQRYEQGAQLAVAQTGIDTDPARVKAMLAAGAFSRLSPAQIEAIHNGADAAIHRNDALARAQAAKALSETKDALAADEVNLNAGAGSAEDRTQLAARYAAIGDQSKAEEWRGKAAEFATVEGSRDWTLPQMDARLAELEAAKRKGGLTPAQAREYNGLTDQRNASATRLSQPGGALLQQQYATGQQLAPLDPNDPAAMQARGAEAVRAAATYGRATVEPITANDLPAFKNMYNGGPGAKLTTLEAIRQFGDPRAIAGAARQIAGPDDGDFRIAATLPDDVARDVLRGGEALKGNPGVFSQAKAGLVMQTYYARTLRFAGQGYAADVMAAAKNFYGARMTDGGETAWNPGRFAEAIETVLGRHVAADGTVYGGVTHTRQGIVMVPPSMTGDGLMRRFSRASVHDYAVASGEHAPRWGDGKPMTRGQFSTLLPTAIGGTRYGFRGPDGQLVADERGQPYVVDVTKLPAR